MKYLYIANEKFTPRDAESWAKYIGWSKLTHLSEVVSLDPMLCPPILNEIKDEYWPHIANEDYLSNYFIDLSYLLSQFADTSKFNILCLVRNPDAQPAAPGNSNYEFLGYDLIDTEQSASALTNCGGFSDVFLGSELTTTGLLPTHKRAVEVQSQLRLLHPEERHANCNVWAIFRVVGP
jgi:hypothetical protein